MAAFHDLSSASTSLSSWLISHEGLKINSSSSSIYNNHEATNPMTKYNQLKTSLESIETPVLLAIGTMGFIGACFSLAIFLKERSSPKDFFLYKIISTCEAAQMLVLTIVRLSMFFHCERDYTCSFFWAHISISIMNLCADVVDFLILFLCIERTWACLLPFDFKNLNKPGLERAAVIFAFVFTFSFSIFQAFEVSLKYDEHENRYRDSPSQFAESDFYSMIIVANTIRFYVTACAIIVATTFSVFGFWRTARRSSHLSRNRDKRREMDLCCLQLCTAAPVVVNHLLYAISLRMTHYSFALLEPILFETFDQLQNDNSTDSTHLSQEEIFDRLKKAESFEYLKTSTNISDALQFYFYLIFCYKVRQGFLLLWPGGRKSQSTSGYKPAPLCMEETPILVKKTDHHQSDQHLWWRLKKYNTEETTNFSDTV